MLEKINAVKVSVTNITTPLKIAVDSEPEKVQQLHSDLNALLILLHNDVRSTLSIIITGTDNDGD